MIGKVYASKWTESRDDGSLIVSQDAIPVAACQFSPPCHPIPYTFRPYFLWRTCALRDIRSLNGRRSDVWANGGYNRQSSLQSEPASWFLRGLQTRRSLYHSRNLCVFGRRSRPWWCDEDYCHCCGNHVRVDWRLDLYFAYHGLCHIVRVKWKLTPLRLYFL